MSRSYRWLSSISLLISIGICLTEPATAGCFDYAHSAHWVSGAPAPGVTEGIVIRGTLAYVADGPDGLAIFDLSDPGQPVMIGAVPLSGYSTRVTVVDATSSHPMIACVASQSGGLQLVDVTSPESPSLLERMLLPSLAMGVAASGDFCYVATDIAGLQVVDISIPGSAAVIGQLSTTDLAVDVAVEGSLAVVATFRAGFLAVDVSNPRTPRLLGSCGASGNAIDVEIAYPFAYGVDYFAGLRVIDLADPNHPIISATLPPLIVAAAVAVADGRAYVAEGYWGLHIVDIRDPRTPTSLGRVGVAESARGVAVFPDGAHIACVDGAGLQVVQVKFGSTPEPIASVSLQNVVTGVAVAGDRAYASERSFAGGSRLAIIDLAAPEGAELLGGVNLPGAAQDVALDGDAAFVALASDGLGVVDISAFNPSSPDTPVLLSTLPIPGIALDVAAESGVAYVAAYESGLVTVDVSTPGGPAVLAALDVGSSAWGIALAGARAYLATGHGLAIIDVDPPDDPELIGELLLGEAEDVAVAGSFAFLVGSSGLRVVDVTSPELPLFLGALATSRACKVAVHGEHAFVADGRVAVQVIDVTDPVRPRLVGGADTPSEARAVATTLDGILVGDGTCNDLGCWGGVYLYPFPCDSEIAALNPAATVALQPGIFKAARPNPFSAGVGTELRFELPSSDQARLRVFDVTGRLIRTLTNGPLAAGAHALHWDGRDARGRLVGPGVYFARLEGSGFAATQRMTMVR